MVDDKSDVIQYFWDVDNLVSNVEQKKNITCLWYMAVLISLCIQDMHIVTFHCVTITSLPRIKQTGIMLLTEHQETIVFFFLQPQCPWVGWLPLVMVFITLLMEWPLEQHTQLAGRLDWLLLLPYFAMSWLMNLVNLTLSLLRHCALSQILQLLIDYPCYPCYN